MGSVKSHYTLLMKIIDTEEVKQKNDTMTPVNLGKKTQDIFL